MISFWPGHFVLHGETPVQTSCLRPLPLQHTSHALHLAIFWCSPLCTSGLPLLRDYNPFACLSKSYSMTQIPYVLTATTSFSTTPTLNFRPIVRQFSDQNQNTFTEQEKPIRVKKKLQILKLMSFSSGSPRTEDKCLCPGRVSRL